MKTKLTVLTIFALTHISAYGMNRGTKRKEESELDVSKITKKQKTGDEARSRAQARERIRSERQAIQNVEPMYDGQPDAMQVNERTLSAPKTEQGKLQELARNLEKYSGKHHWDTRKKLVHEAYESHGFDLKKFGYRQRGELGTELDYNLVMDAVFHRDTQFLQWLLERGADSNAMTGYNPVLFNVNSYEMAQLLIKYGADLNAVDVSGEPLAMLTAYKSVDPRLIELYGAHGQSCAESNTPGGSPLIRLIDQSTLYEPAELELLKKKARLMIFAGVDLNSKITDGQFKNDTYALFLVSKITDELQRKQKSVNHKHVYDGHVEKLVQLGKSIQAAIQEKEEAESEIAGEIMSVKNGKLFPRGVAHLVAQYALEAPSQGA